MKPLSEWTRDELLVCVFESHPNAQSALRELLRRERERCARECDIFHAREVAAFQVVERGTLGRSVTRGAIEAAATLAERIRGLQ